MSYLKSAGTPTSVSPYDSHRHSPLTAAGILRHQLEWTLAVLFWILASIAVSYVALLCAFVVGRGSHTARLTLACVTLVVLAFDLPLCAILLGMDSTIRYGAPLVVAAALSLYALWRTAHVPASPQRTRVGPVGRDVVA